MMLWFGGLSNLVCGEEARGTGLYQTNSTNLPKMSCHCGQKHYLQHAVSIAKEAGVLVRAAFNVPNKNVDFKFDKNDLVTETDKQVETLIFTKLKKSFPSHKYASRHPFLHPGLLGRRVLRRMWC